MKEGDTMKQNLLFPCIEECRPLVPNLQFLVKVRTGNECRTFGLDGDNVVYLDENCSKNYIPFEVLKDPNSKKHQVIYDEVLKYEYYKFVLHGGYVNAK
jgi:hypothetical protein